MPLAIASPVLPEDVSKFEDYFGVALSEAAQPTITLSKEDARRPLISENEELWAYFEKDLQKQLLQSERDTLMSTKGAQCPSGAFACRAGQLRRCG